MTRSQVQTLPSDLPAIVRNRPTKRATARCLFGPMPQGESQRLLEEAIAGNHAYMQERYTIIKHQKLITDWFPCTKKPRNQAKTEPAPTEGKPEK